MMTFIGGQHIFALLRALFGGSLAKHCIMLQLAMRQWCAANEVPRTNRTSSLAETIKLISTLFV